MSGAAVRGERVVNVTLNHKDYRAEFSHPVPVRVPELCTVADLKRSLAEALRKF